MGDGREGKCDSARVCRARAILADAIVSGSMQGLTNYPVPRDHVCFWIQRRGRFVVRNSRERMMN